MNNLARFTAIGISLVALDHAVAKAAQTEKTNIVFIYADDLGAGMLGCYGQTKIKTPNIDKLAYEGIRFINARGCMYCAPARVSLLTGLHDGHSDLNGGARVSSGGQYISVDNGSANFDDVVNSCFSKLNIKDNEVFLAEVVKQAGYRTAQFGKLDWGFTETDGAMKRRGWDHYVGLLDHVRCHGFWPTYVWENGEKKFLTGNTRNDAAKTAEGYYYTEPTVGASLQGDFTDNASTTTARRALAGGTYSQDYFIEQIEQYIDDNKDHPFFLYHPTQLPHGPVSIPEVHPDFVNEPWPEVQKEYASMVKMLDEHVGRIVKKLKDCGIFDNTIIIFTSDNGHELYYINNKGLCSGRGAHGEYDPFKGTMGLAGKKWNNTEGGIHVPIIVSHPANRLNVTLDSDGTPTITDGNGNRREARVTARLTANYDLMPTLAEITGAPMPNRKDGKSYLRTVLGQTETQLHDYIVSNSAIICKVESAPQLLKDVGVETTQWKYYSNMLFNLAEDPGERRNLMSATENPNYGNTELQTYYTSIKETLSATLAIEKQPALSASFPHYNPKHVGYAVKDTTNSGDYLDTGYYGVGGNLARTHEFWLKPDASGSRQGILREGNDTGNYKRIDCRVELNGAIRVEIAGTGITTETGVVAYGKWQHVAITLSPNGSGADLAIFVNGNPVATNTFATLTTDTSASIQLLNVINPAGSPKKIELDEYRYWSVALTQAQIQNLMNNSIAKSGSSEVNLIGDGFTVDGLDWSDLKLYYQFNGDLTDSSDNGRNLTAIAATTGFPFYEPSGALPFTPVQQGAIIKGTGDVELNWSFDGTTAVPYGYRVYIATDADFNFLMAGTPFDVGNDLTYKFTPPHNGVFFAKIVSYNLTTRSVAEEVAESNITSFEILGASGLTNASKSLDIQGKTMTVRNYKGVGGNAPRTYELWLKPPEIDGGYALFRSGDNTAGRQRVDCRIDATGKVRIEFGGFGLETAAGKISYGKWNHLAFVLDGDGTADASGGDNGSINVKIYVNGVKEAETNDSINTKTSEDIVLFGSWNALIGKPNTGQADEFRYWSKALTAAQIQAIMNDSIMQNGPNVTTAAAKIDVAGLSWADLQFYYRFNDSITDASANSRILIPSSTVEFPAYKTSGALPFTPVLQNAVINFEGTADLSWRFDGATGVPSGYKVYIATDIGMTSLVTGAPFDVATINTYEFMPEATGTYYVKIVSYNELNTAMAESIITSIKVTAPAMGINIVQAGNNLTWAVAYEIGVKEYQVVDAATGKIIEVVAAGNASYSTTLPEGVDAKLIIVDNIGYTQTFLPADGNIVKVEYTLTEGWNLIAMPGANTDISEITGVFWGWNGDAYEIVKTPETGQAIWIYSPSTVQAIVTAEKIPAELDLAPGWNMVGPTENMKIPTEAHTVYGWNETYQRIVNEDAILIQGIGYWIFSL